MCRKHTCTNPSEDNLLGLCSACILLASSIRCKACGDICVRGIMDPCPKCTRKQICKQIVVLIMNLWDLSREIKSMSQN